MALKHLFLFSWVTALVTSMPNIETIDNTLKEMDLHLDLIKGAYSDLNEAAQEASAEMMARKRRQANQQAVTASKPASATAPDDKLTALVAQQCNKFQEIKSNRASKDVVSFQKAALHLNQLSKALGIDLSSVTIADSVNSKLTDLVAQKCNKVRENKSSLASKDVVSFEEAALCLNQLAKEQRIGLSTVTVEDAFKKKELVVQQCNTIRVSKSNRPSEDVVSFEEVKLRLNLLAEVLDINLSAFTIAGSVKLTKLVAQQCNKDREIKSNRTSKDVVSFEEAALQLNNLAKVLGLDLSTVTIADSVKLTKLVVQKCNQLQEIKRKPASKDEKTALRLNQQLAKALGIDLSTGIAADSDKLTERS